MATTREGLGLHLTVTTFGRVTATLIELHTQPLQFNTDPSTARTTAKTIAEFKFVVRLVVEEVFKTTSTPTSLVAEK